MESLVAMVIVLLYQVWQISPFCLIIMLYLTIINVNVLSNFFQFYKIECVENKHSLFLPLDSL